MIGLGSFPETCDAFKATEAVPLDNPTPLPCNPLVRIPSIDLHVDLTCVAQNASAIAQATRVPLIAVIKADAYGLGAARVAMALADIVEGFYTFSLQEVVDANLRDLAKPSLVLIPSSDTTPDDFRAHFARPAVWTVEDATRLKSASPAIAVDTGMQRFGCKPDLVDSIRRAGDCVEAFTHATRLEQVDRLASAVGDSSMRLHAAGSSLLSQPAAWLDAVRPGISLYRDVARITTRLIEVHRSTGPAGYTGFVADHHGVIPGGYSRGMRRGPCLVNGHRRRIVEVGMQTAFVELSPTDRAGDEVVLLGDALTLDDIAADWHASEQETLLTLANLADN